MLFSFWKRKSSPKRPSAPTVHSASATSSTVSSAALAENLPPDQDAHARELQNHAVSSGAQAFPHLDQKQLLALYQVAKVRKLDVGEILYRETDPVDYFYLVIKGAIQILRPIAGSKELEHELLAKGSWVADVDLVNPGPRNCRAIARQPTAVMMVDQQVLAQLDDTLKLALFGKLQRVSAQRIETLRHERGEQRSRNRKLVGGLINASHKYDPDVAGSELIQSIIVKIPRLPVSTSALLAKLMDGRSTTQEIVELVKQDPALTGSVLKTINSSRFAFQQKISDVNHAVMLLGYDGVYAMVMAAGIRKCLPDTEVFHEMYERSLAVSNIAFALSQESRIGQPAELATIGLLHQIGMTVTELLKQHYPKMVPLIMYLEHTDMGAALLRAWNIPESVCKTIELQRYPEFAPPVEIDEEVRNNVALLYFAQLFYRRLLEEDADELPQLFIADYLALMRWRDESLDSIETQLLIPKLRKLRKGLPQRLVAKLGESEPA